MQVVIPHVDVPPTIIREWNTSWARMLDTIIITFNHQNNKKYLMFHKNKLIFIEHIFQNISKQMLKINYILNLGQWFKKFLISINIYSESTLQGANLFCSFMTHVHKIYISKMCCIYFGLHFWCFNFIFWFQKVNVT